MSQKIKKPPFGNFFKLWCAQVNNTAEMFEFLMLQHQPISRLMKPYCYLINDPDAAQRVIQNPEDVYVKEGKFVEFLRIPFGQGLVTSEGRVWQSQRQLLQPYFFPKYLQKYADIVTTKTIAHLDNYWGSIAKTNQSFDIATDLMDLVLRIAGEALFSEDLSAVSNDILKWVDFGQKYILSHYLVSPYLPSIVRWKYRRNEKKFDALFSDLINKRRQLQDKPDDTLTALTNAICPDTHQPLPHDLITAQMITLLVTGHETTGSLLGLLWYELGSNPAIYQKLVDEIDFVLQDKIPCLADLPRLPYVRMIIDEALRLYPTIWTINRYAAKDDVLAGYKIPKGSIVFINPYTLQHDPTLWNEPLQFNPERFNRKCPVDHHKMAYIPFGGGQRICIGKNFALQEIQLMVILILQRYHVTLVSAKKPKMLPLVTLKLNSKLLVKLTPREQR